MTIHVPARSHPALVLDADRRPLSYYPLSLWSWHDAVKAVLQDRVDVVATYDVAVRSHRLAVALPSVVALKTRIDRPRDPAFTRFNVFLRDRFRCQYCGSSEDLTFDHLIPRAHGGRTTWDNIVTACAPCNLRKADKTLAEAAMHPAHWPHRPTLADLRDAGRRFPPHFLHDGWLDWLYWEAELEP